MADRKPGFVRRFFAAFWGVVDGTRRLLLNLIFLAVLVGVAGAALWWATTGGVSPLEEKTTLVLDLKGTLVEQRRGVRLRDPLGAAGAGETTVVLRDVLAVLDAAARDPKITGALLLLDDFGGAGPASLREVAAAVERFKAAGKPVVAWGTSFDQRAYFVAAHASEVWLHPMGAVVPNGYGRLRTYWRGAFDRYGITPNVVRAGRYKNAAEVFSDTGPSPETRESEAFVLDALWADWTAAVEKARKLPAGAIQALIDEAPQRLVAAGGDTARLALNEKLVDALRTRDQMRERMIERGAEEAEHHTFRQVSFGAYLAHARPKTDGDAVGVIVAEGPISDGEAPPGSIGGRSTAELIRKARHDESVKAIVLRIDSPGGSALGSELIRREVELARGAGKPVVASMGDLAASGGYWIAMAADEIVADPATITGSIGVIGLLPTAEGLMQRFDLHAEGHATTWLATAYDPRRPIDPRVLEIQQASIDHVYADFTTKAAAGRGRTPQQIDEVAQGRIWTGAQALERGLVDRNGSLGDAIRAAAARAQLPEGHAVRYLERSRGRLARLVEWLGGDALLQALAVGWRAEVVVPGVGTPLPAGVAASVVPADATWLVEEALRRPLAPLAHCLCEAP
jgi:protease-4